MWGFQVKLTLFSGCLKLNHLGLQLWPIVGVSPEVRLFLERGPLLGLGAPCITIYQKENQRSGCISSVGARENLVDQVAHPAEQKSPGLLPYTMAEELTSPLSFAFYSSRGAHLL